ncbi:MAG: adenylosuccinate lyase [Thermodesulfovibrionales bacterium]
MIERYTRPRMGTIWTLETKYRKWLEVEIAACEAWAEMGEIPQRALKNIKEKASFDMKRIDEIERTVKHDVIAFLTSVAEHVGPDSRFIHKGLTSSDVVDTAMALLMREAADIITRDIKDIMKILREKAFLFRSMPCIGRSHGIHAEPMVFGLKFALWHEDMARNLHRLRAARQSINTGKLSGAVGTFSNIPPRIEELVCKKLRLSPERVATQVVQRDRHAEFMSVLAIIAACVEKTATEIRHLQRTEVLEAEEPFSAGQKGSSAMPHKRNPIGSENLSGLARVVRANSMAALENIALWHERDISHSSVERIIIPDSCILVDYMLERLASILKGLQVYPKRMAQNMERSLGLYNSQRVLLALTERGLSREDSYRIVQRNAMESWKRGIPFRDLLSKDSEVGEYLSKKDIASIFRLEYYLKNVEHIYTRVFGKGSA